MFRIVFLLTQIIFNVSFAQPPKVLAVKMDKQCGSAKYQTITYSWCIDRPLVSKNLDILYYMHGAGQSETSWMEGPRRKTIRAEWARMQFDPPVVITISFGNFWHLLDTATPDYNLPLRQIFTSEIIPKLEAQLGGLKGRRLIFGESMGGYNAAMVLLKNPDLFEKVVLGCPAFLPLGPFSSASEISAFYERHRPYVVEKDVQELLDWDIEEFKTEKDWETHDPLQLAKMISPKTPPVHISCGDKDEYAFQEGAKMFYDQIVGAGAHANWELLPGGKHCTINGPSVAHFLAE